MALGPHDSTDADSRTPGPPRAMILLFIRGCGSRQYGKSISSDPLIRAVRSLILLPGQEFNILGLIVPRDTVSMMALILSSREDVLRVSCLALSCVSVKVRWLSRLLPLLGRSDWFLALYDEPLVVVFQATEIDRHLPLCDLCGYSPQSESHQLVGSASMTYAAQNVDNFQTTNVCSIRSSRISRNCGSDSSSTWFTFHKSDSRIFSLRLYCPNQFSRGSIGLRS